jgi:hypothetical protein
VFDVFWAATRSSERLFYQIADRIPNFQAIPYFQDFVV